MLANLFVPPHNQQNKSENVTVYISKEVARCTNYFRPLINSNARKTRLIQAAARTTRNAAKAPDPPHTNQQRLHGQGCSKRLRNARGGFSRARRPFLSAARPTLLATRINASEKRGTRRRPTRIYILLCATANFRSRENAGRSANSSPFGQSTFYGLLTLPLPGDNRRWGGGNMDASKE